MSTYSKIITGLVIFSSLLLYQNCAPLHTELNSRGSNGSSQSLELIMAEEFSKTLHPSLVKNCASCHGISQDPRFAVSDPMAATSIILGNNLVDFNNPSGSKLVTKIKGGHNSISISVASEIQTSIEAWAKGIEDANINVDTTPPSVLITSPIMDATVTGIVSISGIAGDEVGVVGVRFFADDIEIGSEDTAAPFQTSWNTLTVPNNPYFLTAHARDAAGNVKVSEIVSVQVNNPVTDTILPTVQILSPTQNSTISGSLTLQAIASDNISLSNVRFYLNNSALGSALTSAPFNYTLNTLTVANGNYSIQARATDSSGNMSQASVNVTINNVAPDTISPSVSITSPAANATLTQTVTVNVSASDAVGVAGVQLLVDGVNAGIEDTSSPFNISLNTASISNGNHTLTAKARDAAGNIGTSSGVSININNTVSDTVKPTVSISSPSAGNVLGTVTVSANASDNIGVAGVQFLVNGQNIGAEDLTSPYSVSWNTLSLANGSHQLTARARDTSGNLTLSPVIAVNVNNPDVVVPTVSISAPSNSSTVSGAVDIVASASDNIGVVGVQFRVNGSNLGVEDSSSPYTISWNTSAQADGSYQLVAVARDAAGNTSTSSSVTVTVQNSEPVNPEANYTWIYTNILAPRCISCHGASKADAGVRYDTYALSIRTAKAGNLSGSKLYTTVQSGSMPAKSTRLPASQVKAISDWITAGALNN